VSILLLNDGSSAVLLNDGSSKVLLNAASEGITISGTHATTNLYQKRPVILVPVEFSFRIKAGIIKLKFFGKETFEKLSVVSFDSKMLREAFVLPINKMQFKMKNIRKNLEREYQLLTFGNLLSMASESDLIRSIGQLFKK